MSELNVICFGEILWDVFPDDSRIGGAPLNVAVRIKSYGNNVSIISRVGNDALGEKLLSYIEDKNIKIDHIQRGLNEETGKVKVSLDENGSATYEIVSPSAWDNITLSEEVKEAVKSSHIFIYGSLAARNNTSKESLFSLLKHANYKVFDVNLRPPHFKNELLIHLMNESNFIKFNDEELLEISSYFNSKSTSIEENIKLISKVTKTNHICVTRGKKGAVLLYNNKLFYNKGYFVKVKDTVGSGDSFLATLINYLLKNKKPQEAIDLACAVGAIVAKNEGAVPEISQAEVDQFISLF